MDQSINAQVEDILKVKHEFFYKNFDLTPENAWQLEENKAGFSIYTKKNPNNELKMNRTNTVMPFQLTDILNVLVDPAQRANYDKNLESAQQVQKLDSNTQIVYTKLKPPVMLMSGRDTVTVGRTFSNQDKSVLQLATSILYDQIPPNKTYERAELHIMAWLLTPMENGQTSVVVMSCVDPKGNIPTAVINQGAKRQADLVKALVEYLGSKLGKKH